MLLHEFLFTLRSLPSIAGTFVFIAVGVAGLAREDLPGEYEPALFALLLAAFMWPAFSERLFIDFTSGAGLVLLRSSGLALRSIGAKIVFESVVISLLMGVVVVAAGYPARPAMLVSASLATTVALLSISVALTVAPHRLVRSALPVATGMLATLISRPPNAVVSAAHYVFPPLSVARGLDDLTRGGRGEPWLWLALGAQALVLAEVLRRRYVTALLKSFG